MMLKYLSSIVFIAKDLLVSSLFELLHFFSPYFFPTRLGGREKRSPGKKACYKIDDGDAPMKK